MADSEETLNMILDGKYTLATARKRDQGRKFCARGGTKVGRRVPTPPQVVPPAAPQEGGDDKRKTG